MFASDVQLTVLEAERHRGLERQQLVRAAMAARQATPTRWLAWRSVRSFVPERVLGPRVEMPSRTAAPGTSVPACC